MITKDPVLAPRHIGSYYHDRRAPGRRRPSWAFSSLIHYWASIWIVSIVVLSNLGVLAFTFGDHYLAEFPVIIVLSFISVNASVRNAIGVAARYRLFIIGSLGLVALLLLGALITGDAVAAYADFRACEAILFCFALIKTSSLIPARLAKIILDIVLSALVVGLWASVTYVDPYSSKSTFNILLCPIGLYLAARMNDSIRFGLILSLSTYAAVISLYRTYWLVVIVSGLFYGGLLLHQLWRKSFANLLLTLALLGSGGWFLVESHIVENYFTASQDRYIQSIGKTKDLLSALAGTSGLKDGDDLRLGYLTFLVEHPERAILPNGLGSRAFFGNADPFFDQFATPSNTADSGYFYLAYHFGLVASAFGIATYLRLLYKRLLCTSMTTKIYVFSGLFAFGIYMISVGDLFVTLQRGALAGTILGMLVSRRL